MKIKKNLEKKKGIVMAVLVLLFIFTAGTNYLYGEIIPQDRRTNWDPGIQGGIPNRASTQNAVTKYGAVGNGIADDTASIQACLNAVSGKNEACFLPDGTYRITNQLNIPSNAVLRGNGPAKTFIKLDNSATKGVINIGSGDYNILPFINVISGYNKGSTGLTLQDASTFGVGDYIIITQNDAGNPLIDSSPTSCGYKKKSGRSIGQIVEVTAITGNTVTIDPALHYEFESQYDPEVEKLSNKPVEYAGIEDLYIERLSEFGGQGSMIYLSNCAYCWVKNIESYKVSGRHILLTRSFRSVIRDSYIHHAWTYTSGGVAYGIAPGFYTSDSLIENNIVYYFNAGIIFENSGGGNVTAYNYVDSSWLDEGDPQRQLGSLVTHCSFPHMELFEGNSVTKPHLDQIHGGSGYSTFFRNYMDGDNTYDKDPSHPDDTNNKAAVHISTGNYYTNFVGNIFLKPGDTGMYECFGRANVCPHGQQYAFKFYDIDDMVTNTTMRHGNFDYITNSTVWDSSISDHNLPDSLYLTSKPAFFGTLPWPPIGPDRSPKIGLIPAKRRFDYYNKRPNPPNFRNP